jgi:hypothetical protein
MPLILSSFNESRKITKEEALIFINEMKESKVISVKTASYLTGYDLSERILTDQEVSIILEDRNKKHKKALKFAKKKKLEAPILDETPIELNVIELSVSEYPRNHKEDFLPQLEGLVLLQDFVFTNNSERVISKAIKDLYFVNFGDNFDLFVILWGKLLKSNVELRNKMTDSEWRVLIIEDKLTLAASISRGVIYGGEKSFDHKSLFIESLK